MVTKTFHSPEGKETKELTQREIEEFAALGDNDCKKELLKQSINKAKTLQEEIDALKEYVGV